MMQPIPSSPVLIGVSQYSDTQSPVDQAKSPLDMLEYVSRDAIYDALGEEGEAHKLGLDCVAVIRSFSDSSPVFAIPWIKYGNLPKSLAKRLDVNPQHLVYPHVGGNTPQYLVNECAERIAKGEIKSALLCGAEALRTVAMAQRSGVQLDWSDGEEKDYEEWGDGRDGVSPHEMKHGIGLPTTTYPLFENALAHHYGRSMDEHRQACGQLLKSLAEVADENPYASCRTDLSADDIITPAAGNRMIGWPYTKTMCAQMYVDQAAAVLMTSYAHAQALGVPEDKMVFLHGCADTHEKYLVSERVDYHSCPAMRVGAEQALSMAGKSVEDMQHFDLYSCFSSAVEVACDALGIAHDDPRGLTVTGGLPFFGGPGNNYTMHGIAEMAARLRQNAGDFGFVNGNGWFLTKHSFGIYSTQPPEHVFERIDPKTYQAEIDAMDSPALVEEANGTGCIETFSVAYQKADPAMGIIIGRLDDGRRFLSTTMDKIMLQDLIDSPDAIGRAVKVSHKDGRNQASWT